MNKNAVVTIASCFYVFVLFVFSGSARADQSSELVLHLPLDDGQDLTADVVLGNDGNLMGNTAFVVQTLGGGTVDIAPIFGNVDALDFPGVAGDYVEVADDPTLDISGSVTVAAWVNLRTNPSLSVFLDKEETPTSAALNYFLGNSGAGPNASFFVTFVDGSATVNTTVQGSATCNGIACGILSASPFETAANPLGTWRHVAGVYDATTQTLKVYLDGVIDGEASFNASSPDILTTNEPLTIGRRNSTVSGQGHVDGQIDDVRVYDRGLTGDEIEVLATEPDGDGVPAGGDICPTVFDPDKLQTGNNVGGPFGDACVDPTVQLPPDLVIGAGPIIGDGTTFEDGVVIGDNAEIGSNVQFKQNVTVGDNVVLGDEVIVEHDVMLGDNVVLGFKVKLEENVVIRDRVSIGDESVVKKDAIINDDASIGAFVTIEAAAVVPDGTIIPDGGSFP